MIEIVDMMTFVTVVRHSSFTEAALRLGVAKSAVSRRISDMERKLGVLLFDRSTRRVCLSELGGLYYAKCVQIIDLAEAAKRCVEDGNHQMDGRLSVVMPALLGDLVFSTVLSQFAESFPSVRLGVNGVMADVQELISRDFEAFDIAIHVGETRDSRWIARRLGDLSYRLYASPEYLAQFGRPDCPDALTMHYGLTESRLHDGWELESATRNYRAVARDRLCSNNLQVLLDAADRGLGIVLAPEIAVAHAMAHGRLECLLPEWVNVRPVTALYPASRRHCDKVRKLMDLLSAGMEAANGCRREERIVVHG